MQSGGLLWTATGNPSMGGIASTACIVAGRVYVGTSNGYLYCLNLQDGTQIWAQPTYNRSFPAGLSKIIASPVVRGDVVYVGNEAAKVYAFNAADGTAKPGWASPVVLPIDHGGAGILQVDVQNVTGVSSPAIATVGSTDYLIVGCDDGYIYRITLNTLNQAAALSGVNLVYCVESSPTVVGNDVYVGNSHDHGNQIHHLSVQPFRQVRESNICSPNPGIEMRTTLAYSWDGYLFAGVDTGFTFHKVATGTLTDTTPPFTLPAYHYFVGSGAICRNGILYVGNDDGTFRALSTLDLTQVAAFNAGTGIICSSPAIAYGVDTDHNRWVYITTRQQNGMLLAFKTTR